VKIAVSGKGGVGKTLIAGGLAYAFSKKGLKTIAIDADPSPNLALTLGLSPEEANKILPISENKALIEQILDIQAFIASPLRWMTLFTIFLSKPLLA